jgi:hypothetical protein
MHSVGDAHRLVPCANTYPPTPPTTHPPTHPLYHHHDALHVTFPPSHLPTFPPAHHTWTSGPPPSPAALVSRGLPARPNAPTPVPPQCTRTRTPPHPAVHPTHLAQGSI